METTRVEKYKAYRAKLKNSGAPSLNNHYLNNDMVDTLSTTTALPLSEVVSSLEGEENKEDDMVRFEKKKVFLKYFFISLGLAILVVGFVVIGILLFNK